MSGPNLNRMDSMASFSGHKIPSIQAVTGKPVDVPRSRYVGVTILHSVQNYSRAVSPVPPTEGTSTSCEF